MVKNTVRIDGMACGMCEAHISDVIRKTFPQATQVSASHTKNIATFVTEDEVDAEQLRGAIEETGYHYISATSEPYEKKKLFGLF